MNWLIIILLIVSGVAVTLLTVETIFLIFIVRAWIRMDNLVLRLNEHHGIISMMLQGLNKRIHDQPLIEIQEKKELCEHVSSIIREVESYG